MHVDKLDPRTVEALAAKRSRYFAIERSNPGFAVAVTRNGAKSWAYSYKRPLDGRPTYLTIAPVVAMSRDEAMREYGDLRTMRLKDIDPAQERKRAKQEARAEFAKAKVEAVRDAFTVAALVEFYEQHHAKRSLAEDLRMLRKDVLPVLGTRPATEVTPDDVQDLMDSIVKRGSPCSAGLTLAALRKAYNVAIKRRTVLTPNPCLNIDVPKQGSRDRVLTRPELRVFLGNLDAAIPSEDVRDVLQLMLLTAARKGEAVSVEWSEIDREERVWTVPRASRKMTAHTA